MGSIPNRVATSAKRTLRSRVQFPEYPRPGKVWACAGQWFLLGRDCRRNVYRVSTAADHKMISDHGSNAVTNHSATLAGTCLTSLS